MLIRNILVVIDPTKALKVSEQGAYAQGLKTAVITGASMQLLTCLETPASDEILQGLGSLVTQASAAGVTANSRVEIRSDWPQAIVEWVKKSRCDMLFKDSFDHSRAQRANSETSDWVILRGASCPVMLIKNYRDWESRRILAALKLDNADAIHEQLNDAVLSFTGEVGARYGSELHFIAAYKDAHHKPDSDALLARCRVPEEQLHIVEGWAEEVIQKKAEQLSADLIVVGNVGRTGIKASVIGNTAEKLLDQTKADVLVFNVSH
jgi:universal stress protein E